MNLFDSDTQSCNDTAFINLPEGWGDYTITKAALTAPKGKPETYASFSFSDGNQTYHTPIYLGRSDGQALTDGEATRKRIAAGVLRGLWVASKLEGPAGTERLPNFVGKKVRLRAECRDHEGRSYSDIKEVREPETSTPAAPIVHASDDALPGISDPQDNPLADAPAPAAADAPKKSGWKRKSA